MKAKHLIPNAVTLANIALGFLGMVAAAQHQFERSVVLLFCAALCDLADGKLARALDASSQFGMELDSLSDMVSFGIAPSVLAYLSVLHELGVVGMVIAVIYPLCGAVRLARYNSDTGTLAKVTFMGVPIPIAAGYIWSMVMVRGSLSPWLIGAGTLAMAVAMVSTLKVPKFRKGEGLPSLMLFLGLATFIAFLLKPMALTWHIWNGWNIVLVVTNYVMLAKKGHLKSRRERHLKAA
jgi:CDP-diacylglycerol---serine O-phosphatidyltransferase